MAWTVGIDVGGTFTDFVAFEDESETTFIHKTLSTPSNPTNSIIDGLKTLIANNCIDKDTITRVAHGTTVATNSLIEAQPQNVAFITTDGFRDLLEIGRQVRPRMYDLQLDFPSPLAVRKNRFEVIERIDAKGNVLRSLSKNEISRVVEKVRESGAECCAVCLLFSFINPDHERRIGNAIKEELPSIFVSLSSSVQPEFREFERFSTTVLNAYLQPTVASYVSQLGQRIGDITPDASVGINQSSGGLMSIETAQEFPIRTALSGPAAGVIGALHVAENSGRHNVITLDMGGTSADMCLVRNLEATSSFGGEVAGFPIRLPMLDINTVGAGGGSIAWFERDGLLKVGPESAGAYPGPACYGLGGDQPTVSDANLILGRLSGEGLLGGVMPIDIDLAIKALQPIASRIEISIERAAHGVVAIVVANMVRAIRAISVERGLDPRDFTLMPFGGAGALHARDVAKSLGISELLIPHSPGMLCAQGLVVSDLKENFVSSIRIKLKTENLPEIQKHIDRLYKNARLWFASEDISKNSQSVSVILDMRYIGQNFELGVQIPVNKVLGPQVPIVEELQAYFLQAHELSYGFHNSNEPVEIVNLRLIAKGSLNRNIMSPIVKQVSNTPSYKNFRSVWFDPNEPTDCPVFKREVLSPDNVIKGPAIIEQLDATSLLFPGDKATIDSFLNLVVELAK